MAYVHVAHDDIVGNNCVLANRVSLAGEVEVGDWAVIGGHVAIHQWVNIGTHSMIKGGSLIGKDIPPFALVGGEPVRFSTVNKLGLSRRGFTQERIDTISAICKDIFYGELDYISACAKVEEEYEASEDRDTIINFIRTSSRGVCKGGR